MGGDAPLTNKPAFLIVMGVSGSGKTTIGRQLAGKLGWPFYDGDDYHTPANVTKMAAGISLDDVDRAGWLTTLSHLIAEKLDRGESGVIACSALKQAYRDTLRVNVEQVRFIFLRGSYKQIWERLENRKGHFMKAEMLRSQFDDLEEPDDAITIDVTVTPDKIVRSIMERLMDTDFSLGIMGLGVMGRSLARNFERHGYKVVGYDPHPHLPDDFTTATVTSPAALVASLTPPRIILMMIPAGAPVDAAIGSLKESLQAGDIIIDGGNSYFTDTERREHDLAAAGVNYIGMGVSGGESGALWGPSMMPGGARQAWDSVRPMLEAIAAKADDGEPCVTWIGPGGAGHYVKMVHNGIEYGDMELIAEIYDLLHRGAGLSNNELADIFTRWNDGLLKSFLIEITVRVLRQVDAETGQPLLDLIMDIAGQKGTGRWTSEIAMEVGTPTPTINTAVVMRLLSAAKDERVKVAKLLGGTQHYTGNVANLVNAAEEALFAAKLTAYAQGMDLLRMASDQYGWELDLAAIVRIWRAGCIIRAEVLNDIASAFKRRPDMRHLYLDDHFAAELIAKQAGWREVVKTGVSMGVPLPALAASLGYFDAYRSARLPANLIQAQRDLFGAHTYHRTDRDGVFHTEWT